MGTVAEQLGKLTSDLETQQTLAVPYSIEVPIRMGLTQRILLPLYFRL